MKNKDILTLRKILRYRKRHDLSDLLDGAYSELDMPPIQWGDTPLKGSFLVFAPLQKYDELQKLKNKDKAFLLKCLTDIYPPQESSPEIVSINFRLQQEQLEDIDDDTIEDEKVFKIFISYSHVDNKLSGELKEHLEFYGFEVFLAHEDIEPSEEWRHIILQELRRCDVFLPILTKDFKVSSWTGQETGIAYERRKLIIPLKFGLDPFGFIEKYQALNLDINNLTYVSLQIIDILAKKGKNRDKLINCLIEGFAKSRSYAEANEKVAPLKKFQNLFDFNHVLSLIKVSFFNSQIHDESYSAGPFIRHLLLKGGQDLGNIFNIIKKEYFKRHGVPDDEKSNSLLEHEFETIFKVKLK